jgi:hypothetical protein
MLSVRRRRIIVSIEQAAFAIFLRKATARRGDCSIHPRRVLVWEHTRPRVECQSGSDFRRARRNNLLNCDSKSSRIAKAFRVASIETVRCAT